LDEAFGQRFWRLDWRDNAGFIVKSRIDQAADWINDRWRTHRIGFDYIQTPAFPHGGVKEQVSAAKFGIFLFFGKLTGECDVRREFGAAGALS
jgi:hypothetical protein